MGETWVVCQEVTWVETWVVCQEETWVVCQEVTNNKEVCPNLETKVVTKAVWAVPVVTKVAWVVCQEVTKVAWVVCQEVTRVVWVVCQEVTNNKVAAWLWDDFCEDCNKPIHCTQTM